MADPALRPDPDRIERYLEEDKQKGCTCTPLVSISMLKDRTELVVVHSDWCGWQAGQR